MLDNIIFDMLLKLRFVECAFKLISKFIRIRNITKENLHFSIVAWAESLRSKNGNVIVNRAIKIGGGFHMRHY